MSILERDCVLVSKDESGNTIIDMPVTRVNNVEGLGRNPGTAYSVGDVVMCSGSKQLQLICTTAGITSTADLDISANSAGDTINDGTVTWLVAKINHFNNSGVLPISEGGTGASSASNARKNLGLGSVATENTVPISKGGTGATTAKQARANLQVEPVGTVFAFAGNTIPTGYLVCNGSAISRTTYADLYSAIGTTYGSGDGSTTFNLPNLKSRDVVEEYVGTPYSYKKYSDGMAEIIVNIRGTTRTVADGVETFNLPFPLLTTNERTIQMNTIDGFTGQGQFGAYYPNDNSIAYTYCRPAGNVPYVANIYCRGRWTDTVNGNMIIKY